MNLEEFINKIKEINKNSWGYGNEILYLMGKDTKALKAPQKLAGALWIIGRSYAASPQRRSYGNSDINKTNYNKIAGKKSTRPIWPVKTQNDGREGFFDEVAKNLDTSCLKDLTAKVTSTYSYSLSIERENNKIKSVNIGPDKDLLTSAIVAVLSFNRALSKSIEKFDNVPNSKEHDGCEIKCNNHISFASKFLHFYFPNLIFIIDGFAYNGGLSLFNGSEDKKKKRRYFEIPADDKHYFEKEIYDNFDNDIVQAIVNDIMDDMRKTGSNSDISTEMYQNIESNDDEEKIEGGNYIQHCVRSYLLGVFLNSKGIKPVNYIEAETAFCPMPRLTDMIFLNIKKPLTEKELSYQEALKSLYYDQH